MDILSIAPDAHEDAYGILCQKLALGAGSPTPFGTTHCIIPPGGSTSPHVHSEREAFYVTEGQGRIRVGSEVQNLNAGQIVLLPPQIEHQLENASDASPLHFLSVYWFAEAAPPKRPVHAIVSAAPPTPNGPLHLGHVSGPYVAADTYARYLKLRGVQADYLCGSDANQSYVATKAFAEGTTPEDVTEKFGTRNEATLKALGCDLALFLRPVQDQDYVRYVQNFFQEMIDLGALELLETEHLHCSSCDRYLHEARVSGNCPRCGETTCGNGCESCAFVNDCIDLKDPQCNQCQSQPERKRSKRFYLDLAKHQDSLKAWLSLCEKSPRLERLASEELCKGLPKICVSHFDSWGIPVPGEEFEGQVIYEWLEMAAGYRYAAQKLQKSCPEGAEPITAFASQKAEVAQFFGFDNAFFYTFFIPAALVAHDPKVQLPNALLTNQFYRLEGLKFSTSRNHAVWADDMLALVPADALRFHLGLDRPEWDETSFTHQDLLHSLGLNLADGLETWANYVHASLLEAYPDGLRKPPVHLGTHRRFQARLEHLVQTLADAYEARDFSLRRVATGILRMMTEIREFSRAEDLPEGTPPTERYQASKLFEVAGLVALARAMAPLMPDTSKKILEAFGQPEASSWMSEVAPLEAGTTLQAAPQLGFHRAAAALHESIDS